MPSDTLTKLVERFQCPGCTCGSDTKCGNAKLETWREDDGSEIVTCHGHSIGTSMPGPSGMVSVAIGLPEGFNQFAPTDPLRNRLTRIRLHDRPSQCFWTPVDLPIYAKVDDDCLIVRTYSPRTDRGFTDVFLGGTLDDLPPGVPTYKETMARLKAYQEGLLTG